MHNPSIDVFHSNISVLSSKDKLYMYLAEQYEIYRINLLESSDGDLLYNISKFLKIILECSKYKLFDFENAASRIYSATLKTNLKNIRTGEFPRILRNINSAASNIKVASASHKPLRPYWNELVILVYECFSKYLDPEFKQKFHNEIDKIVKEYEETGRNGNVYFELSQKMTEFVQQKSIEHKANKVDVNLLSNLIFN
jgi:hypothetical protein